MNTDSIGIDRVCNIQNLIDTRILLGELTSMGSISLDVGSGVSKVDVLGLGCDWTDDELRGHHPGNILHHSWIPINLGRFMWARCNIYGIVGVITVINVVSGETKISIMLPRWIGGDQKTEEGRVSGLG